jgi:hypothetical protein
MGYLLHDLAAREFFGDDKGVAQLVSVLKAALKR